MRVAKRQAIKQYLSDESLSFGERLRVRSLKQVRRIEGPCNIRL
ncbi:hypothetical protein HMPREF3230_01190 [Gardnerella vaginalis]|uniref:Uncharacterized protein n=1 Tax=Gardnerella vaginalis TaxID=2702 RepID=A0A135Z3K3_GARVA|nr:hypothetical protein HMPREF3230_01190 [Gardnerella vaginalis]